MSEGRRKEFAAFGWEPSSVPDPQSLETFERSRLRWDELASPEHAELLSWYRALIALRRQQPSLRDGKYREVAVTIDESQGAPVHPARRRPRGMQPRRRGRHVRY